MICPQCDGTGFREEYGEYRMKCGCDEGIAICCVCGGLADRVDDEGRTLCDREYFAWEREMAA